jgi:hypothetical protein
MIMAENNMAQDRENTLRSLKILDKPAFVKRDLLILYLPPFSLAHIKR